MKKLLVYVLSLVVILLSLSACTNNSNNNEIKDDNLTTVSVSEPQKYNFYADYAWGDATPEKAKDFKTVSELHLRLASKRILLENVEKTKSVVLDGKDIELKYEYTKVADANNLTFNNYNRAFDNYTGKYNNNKYIQIATRQDTGDICFWFVSNNDLEAPLLSDKDYERIAISELNSRLPSGWNDTYSICEIVNYENRKVITATFTRKEFFGCGLRDPLHVHMDYDGRVNCFDTRLYGLFDEVVETVTKEQLDAAYNALKERLDPDGSKSTLSTTQYLHLDNTGTLYMSVSYNEVSTDKNGDKCDHSAVVYVNVN